MTCIDDLFDWILETIFQKLDLHSRLICKEVCQHWYELLMTRAIFRSDRHIYLNHVLIEKHRPPMTTFMNAKIPYDIVTIDNGNIYLPVINHFDESFWIKLDEKVTEMHMYHNIRPALYKIFVHMPHLEYITFNDELTTVTESLILIKSEVEYPFLPNIKKMVFESGKLQGKEELFKKSVTQLRALVGKELQIVLKTTNCEEAVNFEEVVWAMENVTMDEIKVKVVDEQNSVSKKVLLRKDLPVKAMNFIYDDNSNAFYLGYLENFMKKHMNIEKLKFHSKYFPYSFTQITHLHITNHGVEQLKTLKVFEPLVNLEDLGIHFSTDADYYFGHETHESVNLPKVKRIWMSRSYFKCDDCLRAIANSSFPALEFMAISIMNENLVEHMGLMLKNWKNLTKLRVITEWGFNDLAKCVDSFADETRPLQAIEFYAHQPTEQLTGADFLKMSKVFPRLHSLNIDICEKKVNVLDIIQGIIPAFPEMTNIEIRITAQQGYIPKPIGVAVFEYIETHGQSLRTLDLPRFNKFLYVNDKVASLYEKLPKLVVYGNGRERWCIDRLF